MPGTQMQNLAESEDKTESAEKDNKHTLIEYLMRAAGKVNETFAKAVANCGTQFLADRLDGDGKAQHKSKRTHSGSAGEGVN